MDETNIGGKPRYKSSSNKRGRGASGKTSVVGVVQRGGKVKAQVASNRGLLGAHQAGMVRQPSPLFKALYATVHWRGLLEV